MKREMETARDDEGDEKHATEEETQVAIESLKPGDHVKLMLIARGFAGSRLRGTVIEPSDILHTAIEKTLDGRRRWNKIVSIVKHLDRLMESDSGHEAAKRVARNVIPLTDDAAEERAARPSNSEDQLAVREAFDDLLDLFLDDEVASSVLRLRGSGLLASDIQSNLGITKRTYETVTRRIRRRVAKHLAAEGK